MVSSFSNPGFPPVHAHPTCLPAMDARISAAIDSFEALVRAAFHDAWDSALVAADLAVRRALAPLCYDLALIDAGKSNPVLMFSADGASHDLGHPKLHGDGNQPRISLPVTVHSVLPFFSSSPLLREIAAPSVKPQSNSNASMATHTNNSKPFLSNQEAPTSVQDLGLTLSHKGAKASGPFQWLLHDASDNINIKGYGDHMSVKLQILRLCKQPSMNTNTTKRRHEVLRSLIYNFKNRKAMWHWFFHSSLACYTDGKVVMNDAYLNEINGWVDMSEVGKFVMVMNAKKVFDEMSKRECENIIDLHADFSVLFPSNLDFRSVWDPGDPLAQAVKLTLYLQCKEGKRMGKKQSCFFSRQCGGDWHHAAMPSLVSWVVVRRVGTWKPPHAYQYNLHNDKREKHKDNLFEVQRLLHLITRQMLKPFWNASTIADYIMEIEFLWEKDIKVALWGGNTTSLIFLAFEFWLVVKHTKKVFKQQWLSLTFSTATVEAVMAKAVSQWYFPYHKTQFSILKAQVKSSSFSPRYRAYHQPYINKKMRAILIDWLIKVHYKFELMGETQFLTVNLIDRFFERQMVIRKQLQLVGVTTMLLACKYEVSVPIVVDFVMKEFDSVFEQLKICMVTLYTHLPTSCNSLREVNDRVKALGHLMSATILSPWKAILLEYGFTYVIIELDRFILSRSAMDFDFANMMLFEGRKGPIEMFLREFSSLKQDKPAKPRRHIPQTSEQTLDAPHLIDDYYPNLLVWGSCNNLVIALASTIYLWKATNLSALSRIKALDWLGHVDEIVNGPDYKVEFPISDDRLGPPTISLSDATFGYPSGSVLFRNFNFGIAFDNRITMVGPNGIGQSTILQLIAGELQPISLTVFHSATVQIALSVSTALRALQSRYMLSGGQRSRDAFAKITTMKLHIILLGEPSNHRDLDVVEALIQGLVLVQGGILTVSNGKHLVSGSMDYKKIPLLQSSWEKSYQPFIHHSDFGNIAIELKTCPFTSVLLQVLMFHNWWSYVSSLAPKVEPSTTLLVSTDEGLVQKVSPQAVLTQQNSHIPSKNNKFTLRLQDSLVNSTANSSRFQVLILTLRTRLFFKGRAML